MRRNIIIKSILSSLVVTPLAILPIVSCAKDDANYIRVTFDAGEGKIAQGEAIVKVAKDTKTTFGSIVKPTVVADNKIFVGWTLNGVEFNDSEIVTTSITLKANYVSSTSGFYKTITFSAGTTGAYISGNNVVAVKTGHPLLTVNKPIAAKLNGKFKWWSISEGGEQLPEATPVTTDIVLYPVFVDQVTVTYGQPSAGGVTYYGPTTVIVDSGTTFGLVGRPNPVLDGKVFKGQWYDNPDCTGTPIGEDDTITANKTLYPLME